MVVSVPIRAGESKCLELIKPIKIDSIKEGDFYGSAVRLAIVKVSESSLFGLGIINPPIDREMEVWMCLGCNTPKEVTNEYFKVIDCPKEKK